MEFHLSSVTLGFPRSPDDRATTTSYKPVLVDWGRFSLFWPNIFKNSVQLCNQHVSCYSSVLVLNTIWFLGGVGALLVRCWRLAPSIGRVSHGIELDKSLLRVACFIETWDVVWHCCYNTSSILLMRKIIRSKNQIDTL